MKHYFTIRILKEVLVMRLFIKHNRFGYEVEQFDGKNTKIIEYGISTKRRAFQIAYDHKARLEKIGRAAKVVDITE